MLKLKLQYIGHLMWRTGSWKRPWFWERLKAGEEGDNRGWDGWMASPAQWTWVWVNYGSWWWTGRPGVLQSMGSQTIGQNWATELNLTRQTFVCKVMSLFFNTLSKLAIGFLPRSKCLLILWLQSPSAVILEPKEIKSVTVSIVSPSICHKVMESDAMILVFSMLSFKPAF